MSANADLARQTTMLMDGKNEISMNMPCAPMPVPEGDAPAFMHKCLVTSLTGNQPYYMKGGRIPHLTKKGFFWKSQAPAIHTAVLKFRLHVDAENSAYLDKMDKIDCGWVPPIGRVFPAYELVRTADCHHGTRLQLRAIGVQFNWTLNQEMVFQPHSQASRLGSSNFRNIVGKDV